MSWLKFWYYINTSVQRMMVFQLLPPVMLVKWLGPRCGSLALKIIAFIVWLRIICTIGVFSFMVWFRIIEMIAFMVLFCINGIIEIVAIRMWFRIIEVVAFIVWFRIIGFIGMFELMVCFRVVCRLYHFNDFVHCVVSHNWCSWCGLRYTDSCYVFDTFKFFLDYVRWLSSAAVFI